MKGPILRKGRSRTPSIKDPETLRAGREQLMKVALLLFQELGFHQTSVRDIADRAGISVGTLFNYFAGKDELLLAVINKGTEVWQAPMHPLRARCEEGIARKEDPQKLLAELFVILVRNVHEVRHYVLLGYQETKSLASDARRELFDHERRLMGIFERALIYGAERRVWPGSNVRLKAHSIVILAQTWALRRWLLIDEVVSVEEYAQRVAPMVVGIAMAAAGEPIALPERKSEETADGMRRRRPSRAGTRSSRQWRARGERS